MSTKTNEEIVLNFVEEGWNQGHLSVFDELCAPNYAFHDPNFPEVRTLKDLKQHVAWVRGVFPDFHLTIEDMISKREKVATRWIFTGIYSLPLPGPDPNRHVKVSGFSMASFAFGKMVEQWHQGDQLGLLQQLGLIPKEQASFVAV